MELVFLCCLVNTFQKYIQPNGMDALRKGGGKIKTPASCGSLKTTSAASECNVVL